MKARILLFGKDGQVGWELQRSLSLLGDLIPIGRMDDGGVCCDLREPDGLREICRALTPDIIVNAAAFTDVDAAESLQDMAMSINARAPGVLAEEAARIGALLVHYSTDYVFDGGGAVPWKEGDTVRPLNFYGYSKSVGEAAVISSGCRYLLLRTSWVYGHCGKNFPRTILNVAKKRIELRVVDDQVGAPTSASLLADVTAVLLRRVWLDQSVKEILHVAASGQTSWYEYAGFVTREAERLGLPLAVRNIVPVSSEEFKAAAVRPKNSRLSLEKLEHRYGLVLPEWRVGVSRFVREICDAEQRAISK